jgi:cytidylate kinase
VNWDDETALAGLAAGLPAAFEQGVVLLDGNDVSAEIRAEEIGIGASKWLRSPQYVPPCCSASVILAWHRAW